jgi:hypothetical protein
LNKKILGWGVRDDHQTSDVPLYVKMPVVDYRECIRSNAHFANITSDRTMCVGDRSGKSPCSGCQSNILIFFILISNNTINYYF